MDRRAFLASAASAGAALPSFHPSAIATLLRADPIAAARPPASLASDEEYWTEIQRAFDVDRTLVNLNNGGISPAPSHVVEQMIRDIRFSNEAPTIHMWEVLEPRIETVRRDLAADFGCDPEEMAIVRNASEANETMILGLDLKAGDEVIVTNQNYGRMLSTWGQRARRQGIVIKTISFKVPPPSNEYIVDRFREAITPRTRVIEVTHITNLTGQIMPVRDIVRMARPKGIEVFVDGAHSYAHFPFKRDDLECDYFGTSLHKWLHAPCGAGFLCVRQAKIPTLWSMMGVPVEQDGNIRKYEEIGTHPAANHNAISAALAFHRGMGSERKAARLRLLRNRWAKRLLAHDPSRVHVLTSLDDDKQSCAIALVHVDGLDTAKLQGHLWAKHRIITTPILHAEFNGLRITPNVYTTLDEIDLFADRVIDAMKRGIA
ncbi:MAG: aminotransferase class V-fold PLP-dependent enzyme [Gemmatimonadota bacterium]|nr:aminotransferase class V-fold PLP-dependent enzyme [Gemmatimonadota bacterium]